METNEIIEIIGGETNSFWKLENFKANFDPEPINKHFLIAQELRNNFLSQYYVESVILCIIRLDFKVSIYKN